MGNSAEKTSRKEQHNQSCTVNSLFHGSDKKINKKSVVACQYKEVEELSYPHCWNHNGLVWGKKIYSDFKVLYYLASSEFSFSFFAPSSSPPSSLRPLKPLSHLKYLMKQSALQLYSGTTSGPPGFTFLDHDGSAASAVQFVHFQSENGSAVPAGGSI